MKSLIATLVLLTLVSTNAFARQKRLAQLAEALQLSTEQQQQV